MRKTDCSIRIGTSGWYYDHWKKLFYPPDLPKSRWFEHYAGHFDTVEINNTFYHLPRHETIVKWHEKAPENFLYAVKANRYITHIKRLKDTSEQLKRFVEATALFKEKLGPVLYQLPPSLRKDLSLIESFVRLLPREPRAVFEFRHKSWYEQDAFEMLRRHNVAFCIHDMPGRQSPREVTADIVYLRFHGTTGRYAGNYPESDLRAWAEWLNRRAECAKCIYVYFNNDIGGHAIRNAGQLRELLGLTESPSPAGV
ncbi:MAG: DUF72 domain-containing protein [Phycisphaerales bacterium]|nr:MAG: DUF72 domain-containing protein [Phycisphaerales bacterium]